MSQGGGSAAFDLFIEQVFTLYQRLNAATDRQYVLGAARRMLQVLRHHHPMGDYEEINIETAIELFDELVERAGGDP